MPDWPQSNFAIQSTFTPASRARGALAMAASGGLSPAVTVSVAGWTGCGYFGRAKQVRMTCDKWAAAIHPAL